MDWIQTYTIIGVNVALIGVLATIVIFSINRIHTDIEGVCTRLDSHERRFDAHATRIDQLYRMFVDLLKEGRK